MSLENIQAQSCRSYVNQVYSRTNTPYFIDEPEIVLDLARQGRTCYEESDPQEVAMIVWLLQREQQALVALNQYTQAITVYEYYQIHYPGLGQRIGQGQLLLDAIHSYISTGRFADALTIALGNSDLIKALPDADQAMYHINIAVVLWNMGSPQQAFHQASRALDIAQQTTSERVIAHAIATLGHAHVKNGNFAEGRSLLIQADSLHKRLGRYSQVSSSLATQGRIHVLQGNPEQALPFYAQALTLAQTHALTRSEIVVRYRRSDAYLKLGEPQLALDDLERAFFLADSSGIHEYTHWLHLLDAKAKRDLNRYLAAQEAYAASMVTFFERPPVDGEAFREEAALLEASLPGPFLSYLYTYWWLALGLGFLSIAPRLIRRSRPAAPPTQETAEVIPVAPPPIILPIGWQILGALYIQCYRWSSIEEPLVEAVTTQVRSMDDQGAMMMLASLMIHGPLTEGENLGKRRMRAWRSVQRLFQQHESWGSLPNKRVLWCRWFQEQGWDREPPDEIKTQLEHL